MRDGMRRGIVAALALLGAGCATEEWTQELFAKRTVEVDERFLRVETRAREHGQRIDRVEGRVASLETRMTDTRDLAMSALARASSRVGVRTDPSERRAPRPAPQWVPRAARTLVSVIHVPFGFDRADLDAGAETALASIVKELRANPKMTIDLEGTTDPAGRLEYNLRLSQRRVDTVKRWLVTRGVDPTRIVHSAGRGPLPDGGLKDASKRRVTVKLMSPGE